MCPTLDIFIQLERSSFVCKNSNVSLAYVVFTTPSEAKLMCSMAIRPNAVNAREIQLNTNHHEPNKTTLSINSTALNIFKNQTDQTPSKLTRLTRIFVNGMQEGILAGLITYVVFRIFRIPSDNLALFCIVSYLCEKNFNIFSNNSQSLDRA